MARIIAVVNQKGGVGKTTTTVNNTAALHDLGKRVLLCDFDPQANATSGMGVDKNAASPNIYDVLINGAEPVKAVVPTKYGDVLPSNKALAGAGIEMIGIENREKLLKNALDSLSGSYDYIFIDCPPSLELLTVNALCAAGSLLVPVQCEYYALEGLSDLLSTVRIVKRGLNPPLALEGVLLTMFEMCIRDSYNALYIPVHATSDDGVLHGGSAGRDDLSIHLDDLTVLQLLTVGHQGGVGLLHGALAGLVHSCLLYTSRSV